MDKLMNINYEKLIQGRYEAERLPKDFSLERIVPDFAFNVLNPLGLLYRPMVDEAYLENGGQRPIWPDGKLFAVCLTHDVDAVSLYSLKQSLRTGRANLASARSASKQIRSIFNMGFGLTLAIKNSLKNDRLHCYDRWLEAERNIGARSTFFFWPGFTSVTKHHYTDCVYELTDLVIFDNQRCTVAEMMREIDRMGWEIGLHSSWYSFDDADELKRQKEAIEKALNREVVSVRQHCLHYDIRMTPRIQVAAGFKYDSTLGFNDNIGFRFGTCYPWRLYDLKAEEELPLMEIPLIIQDGALLNPIKGMRLDEDAAFRYFVQITDAVKKVGGVLTLLWHPNHIIKPSWWNLYLRILEYIKSKNAWFATVREVGTERSTSP